MTYLIIILIVVAIWLYIDFNAAKATGRWTMSGIRGISNDIQALKHDAQLKQVENPERQEEIVSMLNENVVDLAAYQASARKRRISSHTAMTTALSNLSK